jgi:hypothetical protein
VSGTCQDSTAVMKTYMASKDCRIQNYIPRRLRMNGAYGRQLSIKVVERKVSAAMEKLRRLCRSRLFPLRPS